jgi:arylsulfatase A-like enzyme/HEAT repeat protein
MKPGTKAYIFSNHQAGMRVVRAALTGLFGGVAAALLDGRQAILAVNGAMEIGLLILQTIAIAGMAGVAVGLLAVGCVLAGQRVATRFGFDPMRGATIVLTAAALPFLTYISIRLFQGGFTSRLPARTVLIIIAVLLLGAIFFLAARGVLAILAWAEKRPSTDRSVVIVIAILVLLSLAFRWADAHLYRRLYLYLHGMLGALSLGGLAIAFRIAILRERMKIWRRKLIQVAVLVMFGLTVVGARMTVEWRQTVKSAIWENTATTADVLRMVSFRSRPVQKRPTSEMRDLQKDRNRRVLEASAGDFPVFPGTNVLLVTVDALRADRLGAYGFKGRNLSPGLDGWIAEKGIVFERAYCPAPHSSFAITSLHTSRYTRDEAMLEREITYPTMAEVFKNAGYMTHSFFTKGIFFTEGEKVGHYRRNNFGFERVVHGAPPPDELTAKALDAIEHAARWGDKPSFFWVHYFNVHEPYEDTRFGDSPVDRYEGEIARMDPHVTRLVEGAEKAYGGNLLVVFSADHGEEFNDHGGYYHGSSLYEEQIRVPLVIRVPGVKPHRVTMPVSFVGVAPTLLNLAGISPPHTMIGQDLRPALFGGNTAHVAEPVFSAVMNQHMVLRWPWKLITDPSLGLYELYNLENDDCERVNLYDRRRKLADELIQEIYVWLDAIGQSENEVRTVLNLGHMQDLRAIPGLVEIARNQGALLEDRVEAIDLLGTIKDRSVTADVKTLLLDENEKVATAAALALGDLGDMCGRELILDALFADEPSIRDRAALTLGRREEPAATEALVEALGRDDVDIREQAIRMLGRLGEPCTVDALLTMLAEERTRYLTVLALGKIGDPRAYEALMDVIENEKYTDVRGYAVVALGWLEMSEAIPRLMRVLVEEPEIKWTTESLIRLGAVGRAPLFGMDISKDSHENSKGFRKCFEKPKVVHGGFLDRTFCNTKGSVARVEFFTSISGSATLIVRARHLTKEQERDVSLEIFVDSVKVGEVPLGEQFQEFRIVTSTNTWLEGRHQVQFKMEKPGSFALDHVLVLANDSGSSIIKSQ